MRFIRPSLGNKDNKENALQNTNEKERMQELKLQIKSAYTQISMLKEANKKLAQKVKIMEDQIQNTEILKQEIQFLKEQESNYKRQLNYQDEINKKLREQLDRVEAEKNELVERLKAHVSQNLVAQIRSTQRMQTNRSEKLSFNEESGTRIQDYKSVKAPYQTTARPNLCMSSGKERQKQNHHSTPKSKVKICLDQFMAPENPIQRKRVFF